MTVIGPTIGWFEIIEIPTYDLNEVTGGIDEYIDKSYVRVGLFYNMWLSRYTHPHKVVFYKGSDFKRNFTHFIKYFDIKTCLNNS